MIEKIEKLEELLRKNGPIEEIIWVGSQINCPFIERDLRFYLRVYGDDVISEMNKEILLYTIKRVKDGVYSCR